MDNTEMYKVVMFNDDTTPTGFFMEMLNVFFQQPHEKANETISDLRKDGRVAVGLYPKEKAERLAVILMKCAETEGYKDFKAVAEKAI